MLCWCCIYLKKSIAAVSYQLGGSGAFSKGMVGKLMITLKCLDLGFKDSSPATNCTTSARVMPFKGIGSTKVNKVTTLSTEYSVL